MGPPEVNYMSLSASGNLALNSVCAMKLTPKLRTVMARNALFYEAASFQNTTVPQNLLEHPLEAVLTWSLRAQECCERTIKRVWTTVFGAQMCAGLPDSKSDATLRVMLT